MFELAVVNETSVFELSRFDCSLKKINNQTSPLLEKDLPEELMQKSPPGRKGLNLPTLIQVFTAD